MTLNVDSGCVAWPAYQPTPKTLPVSKFVQKLFAYMQVYTVLVCFDWQETAVASQFIVMLHFCSYLLFRLNWMHEIIIPIVWAYFSLSDCLSVTRLHCAITAERIEVLFGDPKAHKTRVPMAVWFNELELFGTLQFKSDPVKMVSISGCQVTLCTDSDKPEMFMLTDPSHGASLVTPDVLY